MTYLTTSSIDFSEQRKRKPGWYLSHHHLKLPHDRWVVLSFVFLLTSLMSPTLFASCENTSKIQRQTKKHQVQIQRVGKRIRAVERRISREDRTGGSESKALQRRLARLVAREGQIIKKLAVFATCAPASASRAMASDSTFSLINAESNTVISDYTPLNDGEVINLALIATDKLSIRVDAPPEVKSVRLILNSDEIRQTESQRPFTLVGDRDGNYNPWLASLGDYSLEVLLYSRTRARGDLLGVKTIQFTVESVVATPTPRPTPTAKPTIEAEEEFRLMVSKEDTRADAVELQGSRLSDSVFIFFKSEQAVSSVTFFIDQTTTAYQVESSPPYDLEGGSVLRAKEFDTNRLSDGMHTIYTTIDYADGRRDSFNTSFFVWNSSMAPTATPTFTPMNTPTQTSTPQPQPTPISGKSPWISLNPGAGGQIQEIKPDRNIPGRLYLSVDMEGLYVSNNSGQSWEYIWYDGQHGMNFTVSVEPGNSNRIYAGNLYGVAFSDDAGKSWQYADLPVQPEAVAAITIDVEDVNKVYAGPSWRRKDSAKTNSSKSFPTQSLTGSRVIYVSEDRGATWKQEVFESQSGYRQVYSISDVPNSDDIWIGAHAGVYLRRGANDYVALPIPTGIPSPVTASSPTVGCRGATLSPDGRYLYAVWGTGEPVGQGTEGKVFLYDTWQGGDGSWQLVSNEDAPSTDFFLPTIDPRSSSTTHRVLFTTQKNRIGLWEAEISINSGKIVGITWEKIGGEVLKNTAAQDQFDYQAGWENRSWNVRFVRYSPLSWDDDQLSPEEKTFMEEEGKRVQRGKEIYTTSDQAIYRGRLEVAHAPVWDGSTGTSAGYLWPTKNAWFSIYDELVDVSEEHPTYRGRGFQSVDTYDLAAHKNYVIQVAADHGTIESFDAGYSWTAKTGIPNATRGNSVEISTDPSGVPVVFAHASKGYGAAADYKGGLWVKRLLSSSQQDSWMLIAGQSTNFLRRGAIGRANLVSDEYRDISFDPHNKGRVLIGTREHGIYLNQNVFSLLDGDTANDVDFINITAGSTLENSNIGRIVFDSNIPNRFFFASRGLYIGSVDGSRLSTERIFLPDNKGAITTSFSYNDVESMDLWNCGTRTCLAVIRKIGGKSGRRELLLSQDEGGSWKVIIQEDTWESPHWSNVFAGGLSHIDLKGLVGDGRNLYFGAGSFINRRHHGFFKLTLTDDGVVEKIENLVSRLPGDMYYAGRISSAKVTAELAGQQKTLLVSTRGAGSWALPIK